MGKHDSKIFLFERIQSFDSILYVLVYRESGAKQSVEKASEDIEDQQKLPYNQFILGYHGSGGIIECFYCFIRGIYILIGKKDSE